MARVPPQYRKSPVPPVPKMARPRQQYRRLAMAAVAVCVLLMTATWVGFARNNGPESSRVDGDTAALAASAPIIGQVFTPTAVPPTPTPTVEPVEQEANSDEFADANTDPSGCASLCLVRMANSNSTITALSGLGAAPAYTHDGQLWAGLAPDIVRELAVEGTPLDVIGGIGESQSLYVIRLPDDAPERLVSEHGEILDQIGNQYVVAMSARPPNVKELFDWGISVEKMPPLLPAHEPLAAPKPIVDPWDVAASISVAQLKQRINDLVSSGTEPGELGSREYTTAGNVQAAEYLYRRLASYGLEVWYEDFISDTGQLLLNVVAEIPGSDDSEIYLLTAHFDSIAPDGPGPEFAPGALDNGSGVAVLLETARALSEYQLDHPIHVVFFNAEEEAFQGSNSFARHASNEGRPYVGGINVDSVGVSGDGNPLFINATGGSQFVSDAIAETNRRWGLGITVMQRNSDKIRADEYELVQYGFPVVMMGAVLYGDERINTKNDVVSQVDFWKLQAVGQLIVLTMIDLTG